MLILAAHAVAVTAEKSVLVTKTTDLADHESEQGVATLLLPVLH